MYVHSNVGKALETMRLEFQARAASFRALLAVLPKQRTKYATPKLEYRGHDSLF